MFLLSRFLIQGHSMEPTLLQGQNVLVSSIPFIFSKPKIGDIVVIRIGHKNRHSGKRSQIPSGIWRSASRISPQGQQRIRRFWTRRVPDGNPSSQNDDQSGVFIKRITKIYKEKYFVSGDNEKDSLDSRRFGWVSKKDILGKVILDL